jgi:hypothetical protein
LLIGLAVLASSVVLASVVITAVVLAFVPHPPLKDWQWTLMAVVTAAAVFTLFTVSTWV